MTTLQEFYDMLLAHDWYYDFSDDHYVWARGVESIRELKFIAAQSQSHQELLEQFNKHFFSGDPWGTEKQPKPERPR